jgi:hypothetical protein
MWRICVGCLVILLFGLMFADIFTSQPGGAPRQPLNTLVAILVSAPVMIALNIA